MELSKLKCCKIQPKENGQPHRKLQSEKQSSITTNTGKRDMGLVAVHESTFTRRLLTTRERDILPDLAKCIVEFSFFETMAHPSKSVAGQLAGGLGRIISVFLTLQRR
jgi:hypothetical protein